MRGEPLQDRLMSRLVETDTGCWEYTGAMDSKGYGSIGTGGRSKADRAHRVSWRLHHGEIPAGMYVCHRCDNPPCCNPAHLFLGTVQDNNADREAKGRNRIDVAISAYARKARAATHCKRGHEFTEANTYWHREKRNCRNCRAAQMRRQYAKRQSAPGS